jgi:hypothetical protein
MMTTGAEMSTETGKPIRPVHKVLVDYKKQEVFLEATCENCTFCSWDERAALEHARDTTLNHKLLFEYSKRYYVRGN